MLSLLYPGFNGDEKKNKINKKLVLISAFTLIRTHVLYVSPYLFKSPPRAMSYVGAQTQTLWPVQAMYQQGHTIKQSTWQNSRLQ